MTSAPGGASSDPAETRPARRRLRIGLIVVAGFIALYLAAGFFLPRLLQQRLAATAEAEFGLVLSIEETRINPLLLTLEMTALRLAPPHEETPLVVVDALRGRLSWRSILERAWVLEEARIVNPHVRLAYGPEGFELPEPREGGAPQEPPAADDDPQRETTGIILRDAALLDGTFEIAPGDGNAASIVVSAIGLEADELSTRRDDPPGHYRLRATLPGDGALSAQGTLILATLASTGRFDVSEVPIAPWWPLLQENWALAPPEGRLGASFDYRADAGEQTLALLLDALVLRADGLVLARPDDDEPLLSVREGTTGGGQLDLGARELRLDALTVNDGDVRIDIDADGESNWGTLRKTQDEAPQDDSSTWDLALAGAVLDGVRVRHVDRRPDMPRVEIGRVDGRLDLVVDSEAETTAVVISAANGKLADIAYVVGDNPGVTARLATLEGGMLDSGARRVEARNLVVDGAQLEAFIDAAGEPHLPFGAGEGDDEDTDPWEHAFDEVSLSSLAFRFEDRRYDPVLAAQLAGSARFKGVERAASSPISFELAFKTNDAGELSAQGEIAQNGTHAEAQWDLTGFDLTPFRTILTRFTTLDLVRGALDGNGQLRYVAEEAPQVQIDGALELVDFRVDEAGEERALFSGRSLRALGAMELSPQRLLLNEVVMDRPVARIQIDDDRTLNLARIMRKQEHTEDLPDGEQGGGMFPIRIERIDVQEATVDFADESLILPFAAQVEELSGSIVGVDNSAVSEATVAAEGRIAPHGAALVEGRIRPFSPNDLTDLQVRFDNVELPLLSPYSATFAGRTIAEGRLWLDVLYRVFDRRLEGENSIILENFSLGERVAERSGMDLPLELALALLRDADGRVELSVPLKGDVDDPSFRYQEVFWSAIGNVLTRIVEAPFRFLGNLVGREDGDPFEGVGFEPGDARLSPAEEENLDGLAEALQQRPQLRLRVRGTYDPAEDDPALREANLREAVAKTARLVAADEEYQGPLDFGDSAVRAAVVDLFESAAGPGSAAAFRAEFIARTPEDDSEVRGETALHREMFALASTYQPLQEDDLQRLAERRAKVVAEYLIEERGISGERIELTEVRAIDEGQALETELSVEVLGNFNVDAREEESQGKNEPSPEKEASPN